MGEPGISIEQKMTLERLAFFPGMTFGKAAAEVGVSYPTAMKYRNATRLSPPACLRRRLLCNRLHSRPTTRPVAVQYGEPKFTDLVKKVRPALLAYGQKRRLQKADAEDLVSQAGQDPGERAPVRSGLKLPGVGHDETLILNWEN